MTIIEVRELTKQFGEVTAVDRISLRSGEGEFLVLLGPSGCGKTTLLRMIAGLERPSSGHVLIGGRIVNDLPPRARKIAMVFQSYALYPHMNVRDNIAFPLKAQGMPRREQLERIQWSASILGIDRYLNRKPRQLSGGERQRVALARALVREPSVFLLDEPLSNLDAKLRAMARDELQTLQRRIGITTIYVTHDQVEAMGMGDRIAVMYEGRLRQVGTPREIYDDPADTFVATFVGSPPMNLLERDDQLLGFRPEHLLPKDAVQFAPDALEVSFQVTRQEYLGADRLLYGLVSGLVEETKTISRLPSTISYPVQAGEKYDFVVRRGDVKMFDKRSGQRTAAEPAFLAGTR